MRPVQLTCFVRRSISWQDEINRLAIVWCCSARTPIAQTKNSSRPFCTLLPDDDASASGPDSHYVFARNHRIHTSGRLLQRIFVVSHKLLNSFCGEIVPDIKALPCSIQRQPCRSFRRYLNSRGLQLQRFCKPLSEDNKTELPKSLYRVTEILNGPQMDFKEPELQNSPQ
jgi:hypothetical protein